MLDTQKKTFEEIIQTNNIAALNEIIENSENNQKLHNEYNMAQGVKSLLLPLGESINPVSYLSKIDVTSDLYRYSVTLSVHYLQGESTCDNSTKNISDFSSTMERRGDNSPLVHTVRFFDSLLVRNNKNISSIVPTNGEKYKICKLLNKNDYLNTINEIKDKYQSSLQIDKSSVGISMEKGKYIEVDAIYFQLPDVISHLYGLASMSESEQKSKSIIKDGHLFKQFCDGVKNEPSNYSNSLFVTYGTLLPNVLNSFLKTNKIACNKPNK